MWMEGEKKKNFEKGVAMTKANWKTFVELGKGKQEGERGIVWGA